MERIKDSVTYSKISRKIPLMQVLESNKKEGLWILKKNSLPIIWKIIKRGKMMKTRL